MPDELIIQQDAFGYILSLSTGTDLTDATSLLLWIRKPDDSLLEKDLTAADIINPALGTVKYIIEDGDLDQVGAYKLQLVNNSPGVFLPSGISKFKVASNA